MNKIQILKDNLENYEPNDIYYYGFIGGDAGNYFNGDYIKIIPNEDNTFRWEDSEFLYNTDTLRFKTKKEALEHAINILKDKLDDGSELVVNQDPDELYDLIYPDIIPDDNF